VSLDWYPGIREFAVYWPDATMLQQTYEALEKNFIDENDACIDCAKAVVEVACRIIVDELDNPSLPVRPAEANPPFGMWVSAAVRVLKLGDVRDNAFQKLVSQHHKLTETLGTLRNDAGPVSHGREGFIARLSTYHRRAAILSADAIVAFLHQAYLEAQFDLAQTREPYERFSTFNDVIDENVSLEAQVDDEGDLSVTVRLPGGDFLPVTVTPSQFLFQVDRAAYIEALNAARSVVIDESLTDGEPL
jgi:abortive infection Abi-like protein